MKHILLSALLLGALGAAGCSSAKDYKPVLTMSQSDSLYHAFEMSDPVGDFTMESVFPNEITRAGVEDFVEESGGLQAYTASRFRYYFVANNLVPEKGAAATPRYDLSIEIDEYEVKPEVAGMGYRMAVTYRVTPKEGGEPVFEERLVSSGLESYQTDWGELLGNAVADGLFTGLTGIPVYSVRPARTVGDVQQSTLGTFYKTVKRNTSLILGRMRAVVKEAEAEREMAAAD